MTQADLDGDDQLDLVISAGLDPTLDLTNICQAQRLEVWRGSPDGSFKLDATISHPGGVFGELADVNGDNHPDLVIASCTANGPVLEVLCGKAESPFFGADDNCGFEAIALSEYVNIRDMKLAFTGGVNQLQLAVALANSAGQSTLLSIDWRQGSFSSRALSEQLTADEQLWVALEFLAVGQLEVAGELDLVASNGVGASLTTSEMLPQVFIFKNAFAEESALTIERLHYELASGDYANYAEPMRPVLADFDLDGQQDLAVINYGVNDWGDLTGKPVVFFGDGQGGWTFTPLALSLGGEPIEGYAVDLDNNCYPDLLGLASDQKGVSPLLFEHQRNYANGFANLELPGAHRELLLHGDYDQDGRTDLITAKKYGRQLAEHPLPDNKYNPLVVHLQRSEGE